MRRDVQWDEKAMQAMDMQPSAGIERPGSFYLGKLLDPRTGEMGEPLYYRASDLTTHAVCLGMTGSGKTGLCIDLLEEAALNGIPSIVIDPKGDITNLLLTFPDLRPADFLPWVNVEEVRLHQSSVEARAEQAARQWAEELAHWGIIPERIRKLRQSAEFTIFTPGSDAGVPINVLPTFSAPALSWEEHAEELREKIAGTVTALLGLANIAVDSVHRREHVLLSHIVERAWRAGENLDLAQLIAQIQNPPMRRLGVFDTDAYFPPSDRTALAMRLNSIIAAPSFETWLRGVPLDVPQVIRSPDGRPRTAIFYVAHLSASERMFFVTLLLQQIQTWMQALSGATSLRSILYFDEVFGYFPPHPADPPSKRPLLTLLKQARAFGLGIMLVTQNPVDLDYKGLTNAGTWFIGKLQTDRDKMRVLEALEGVALDAGSTFNRADFDRLIGSLKRRQFIMHNVHEEQPVVFTTRWTMSYLRGPLTRSEVRRAMKEPGKDAPSPAANVAEARPRRAAPFQSGVDSAPPSLPAAVPSFYFSLSVPLSQALRVAGVKEAKGILMYEPAALGKATIRYTHKPSGIDVQQDVAYLLRAEQLDDFPDWEAATPIRVGADDLGTQPFGPARYAPVSPIFHDGARFRALQKALGDFLYLSRSLVISYNPSLNIYARLEDRERDFRERCQEAARAARDNEIQKVQARFQPRISRLEECIVREEQELDEDRIEHRGRKREELVSAGESLFGWLRWRTSVRAVSVASRKRRLTQKAEADIEESIQALIRLRQDLEELHVQATQTLAEVNDQWAAKVNDVQELRVTPSRSDIVMKTFGLVWLPYWGLETDDGAGGMRRQIVPAYRDLYADEEALQRAQALHSFAEDDMRTEDYDE